MAGQGMLAGPTAIHSATAKLPPRVSAFSTHMKSLCEKSLQTDSSPVYRYRELSGGGTVPTAMGRPGARSAYAGAWSEPYASIQTSPPTTLA